MAARVAHRVTPAMRGECGLTIVILEVISNSYDGIFYFYFQYVTIYLAERTGLEPATPGVTGQYSKPTELPLRTCVVGVAGFEPATYGL